MKYSEFKREVEKLGFDVNVKNLETGVRRKGNFIMTVDAQRKCIVDTTWDEFQYLRDDTKEQLFNLGCKLAKTPLAEREEEKRYWLRKIPVPLLNESGDRYFCKPLILIPNFQPCVDEDRSQNHQFQTIFTETEISEMDITGFQEVEVTE